MASWNRSFSARLNPRKLLKDHRYTVLSFIIPFLIMWLAYASRGIFPFGNRNVLTIDLYHQYAPFMAELRAKILGGESLFYSWTGGLGNNFYALYAYYLASPLNILTILFPPSLLSESILFLTLLKIGLAGACFYTFLKGAFGREGHYAVGFSIMYALSAYVLSYSWNIMWLDGIYLLPLIILGLIQLLRDNRFMLYCISLALMIVSNYYIAFFVCLFIILYFPVLLLRYQAAQKPSEVLRKSGQFAFFSMLAGGLASFMMLPTYFSLQLTSAANDSFPKDVVHYFDFFDYLGQHLMLPAPTIRDGMPNMYAGLLILILLPVYFLSNRVRLKEKFAHIVLILVMILSFNLNILNFIWHGFHFPNQLPYRNSFVYIFLLLAMLYPAIGWLKELRGRQIGVICMALMLLPLLAQKLNQTTPSIQSIFVTILFLAIYAAVLTLDRTSRLGRQDLARAVLLLIVAELVVNTMLMVHEIDMNEHYSSRDGYASGRQVRAIRNELDNIENENEKLFYRMEIMPPKTTNDAFLYQYNGLSLFSSTAATKPVRMFENLGYHSNGINSYKYEGSTVVLDSLFGLEYLMRRSGNVNETVRQMTVQNDQLTVYHNPYALPIGYLGTRSLADWNSGPGNPLDTQNRLVEALGGLPEVLMPMEQIQASMDNISLNETSTSVYKFNRPATSQRSTARIQVLNDREQTLYAYLKVTANQPDEGYFLVDGERISFNARRSTMVDLGQVHADANIELNLIFGTSAPQDSQFELYTYALDEQAFSQSMALIGNQAIELTKFSDRAFAGTVTTTRDGVFLMTIPYDSGWRVKVNGEAVETFAVDDGLLAFNLDAGEHELSFAYTPPWFVRSLLISLASLLVLLFAFWLSQKGISGRKAPLPRVYMEWDILDSESDMDPDMETSTAVSVLTRYEGTDLKTFDTPEPTTVTPESEGLENVDGEAASTQPSKPADSTDELQEREDTFNEIQNDPSDSKSE